MPGLRWSVYLTSSVAIFLTLVGCITPGNRITIDSPANAASLERNQEMPISVTATDPIGVTRIELWVAECPCCPQKVPCPKGKRSSK